MIPKEEGYLAHEVNPDLLFDRRYQPQVYGVDMNLWHKMKFGDNNLVADDIEHIDPLSASIFLNNTYAIAGTVAEELKKYLRI